MNVKTKVTRAYQTQVPAKIRERYRVGPGDTVIWEETPRGLLVRFRQRRTLDDIVGTLPGLTGGDSVAAKKRAQRGTR